MFVRVVIIITVLSGTRLLDLIIILRIVIFLNRKYQCVSRNCAKEGAAVYLGNFIDDDNSNETSNVIGLSDCPLTME